MLLTHPLLLTLAKQVDAKLTGLRWIDLYAAQYVIDLYRSSSANCSGRKVTTGSKGKTPDLFESMEQGADGCLLNKEDIVVLAVMCSCVVSQGQTFLSLTALPQEIFGSIKACGYQPSFQTGEQLWVELSCLEQPDLLRVAGQSDAYAGPGERQGIPVEPAHLMYETPLVLWQDRLYLAKYWMLHQTLEAWLQTRRLFIRPLPAEQIAPLAKMMSLLFKLDQQNSETATETDWQAVAAAHTLINPFSLISGGPGTGKTTTAARLLYLLMYQHQLVFNGFNGFRPQGNLGSDPIETRINIHLLAPTGKAAVRLADAIRAQLAEIETALEEQGLKIGRFSETLPEGGETLHRFLFGRGGLRDAIAVRKAFRSDDLLHMRHHQSGNLSTNAHQGLDVIIVDESSMMDLALMVELVSLIPAHTKLILMGDPYQLPAVDPGQVFADCVARFSGQPVAEEALSALEMLTGFSRDLLVSDALSDTSELGFQPLCNLRKTYRFDGDLKLAADFIKHGELQAFSHQFRSQSSAFNPASRVVWHALTPQQLPDYAFMVEGYEAYFDAVSRKATLPELATLFETYQLLCSTLEGPLGVETLNRYIEQHFSAACYPHGRTKSMPVRNTLYHGKAILVTRNHPHLGIFNGDIGFVIEEQDGNLNVHFPEADHAVTVIAPGRIREWQTAYAMTVHKSQGSEYRRVGVLLADYARELLTRSLLYTALTRSKEHCDIWASEDALKKAMATETVGLIQ
jgi:exodeoxyribonuclease V alpha subunit